MEYADLDLGVSNKNNVLHSGGLNQVLNNYLYLENWQDLDCQKCIAFIFSLKYIFSKILIYQKHDFNEFIALY